MLIAEKLRQTKQMSEAEQGVAAFLLKNGREVSGYSTRNLAEATYTSPATVIRLCKKLGFKGFEEFKKKYLEELQYLDRQGDEVDRNFPFSKDDTMMRAADRISRLYEDTIKDTMELLSYPVLQKAVRLLKNSRNIYIFSAGTAINQAESFREKMLKIGKRVSISNNLNYQLYEAGCMTPEDVAVIISYSGETEKMLQIARECRKLSAPVIAMTSFGESSLAELAVCKLTVSSKESLFHNIGDFSSHVSVQLLLDILYSSYFWLDYEENYKRKLKKTKELEKLRKSSNSIIMDRESGNTVSK
ncbi:MAG: MurR/RpiR family transcriptional regulator [Enterocloster sp.]